MKKKKKRQQATTYPLILPSTINILPQLSAPHLLKGTAIYLTGLLGGQTGAPSTNAPGTHSRLSAGPLGLLIR